MSITSGYNINGNRYKHINMHDNHKSWSLSFMVKRPVGETPA